MQDLFLFSQMNSNLANFSSTSVNPALIFNGFCSNFEHFNFEISRKNFSVKFENSDFKKKIPSIYPSLEIVCSEKMENRQKRLRFYMIVK